MTGNPGSTLLEGQHRYPLRVYYEDTDAAGIVYHANYLRFAERARTEAMRALGIPHAELLRDCNLMFVVRRIKVDYLRPARLDDSLVVVTEFDKNPRGGRAAAPGRAGSARILRGSRSGACLRAAGRPLAGAHSAALAAGVDGDAGGTAAGLIRS